MTCESIILGGVSAIVCSRGRRVKICSCCAARPGTLLCDWKVPGGTCSKAVCPRCSTRVGEDKDLCRAHAIAWGAMLAEAGQPSQRNATPEATGNAI